jgi:hypothetical protein
MSQTEKKYKEFRVEYVARVLDQGQPDEELAEFLRHDVVASTHHDQLELVIRPRTLEVENVTAPFPSQDPQHAALYRRFCQLVGRGFFDAEEAVTDDFCAKSSSINNAGVDGQFDYLVESFGAEGLANLLDEESTEDLADEHHIPQ